MFLVSASLGSKLWQFITGIFPFVATIFVITTLNDLNQVLWFIALLMYILDKSGITKRIFKKSKLKNKTIVKLFDRWLKTISIVGKLEDDYIEETGDAIIKTVKEAKEMKKWIEALKLWLIYNKTQILGLLALVLFGLDYFFGFTAKFGVDKNIIFTLAAVILFLLFWVLGINDGWTSNTANQIKEDAKISKREAEKQSKDFQEELAKVDRELARIELLGVPQEWQQEYNVLKVKKSKLEDIINQIRQDIK